MRRASVLAGLAAILLASCGYFRGRTAPYRPPAIARSPEVKDGRTLYLRDCAWCHGERGQGTERAPDLLSGTNGPALTDFMLSSGRMPIGYPSERVDRKPTVYTPAQIRALVDFVETLGAPGPPIPHPEPDLGDLGAGAELYQENCAACHGTTAIGGALSAGRPLRNEPPTGGSSHIAPPLSAASPKEVAEAMLTGPGTMPVFGPETFSKSDVDSIVAYVEYLQHPSNRGGLPMGKIGPWSEGAVGWILGFGLLLIAIRWIGKRR